MNNIQKAQIHQFHKFEYSVKDGTYFRYFFGNFRSFQVVWADSLSYCLGTWFIVKYFIVRLLLNICVFSAADAYAGWNIRFLKQFPGSREHGNVAAHREMWFFMQSVDYLAGNYEVSGEL